MRSSHLAAEAGVSSLGGFEHRKSGPDERAESSPPSPDTERAREEPPRPDTPRSRLPLVGALRELVDCCLSRSGLSAPIEETEGPYPSPTLLINGTDVTERPVTAGPSCRLDSPSEKEILAALSKVNTARETSRRAQAGG